MTARFDRGAGIPCHRDIGVGVTPTHSRVADIRRRFLLGEYDTDYVVTEVARRILASQELGQRAAAATTSHRAPITEVHHDAPHETRSGRRAECISH